MEIEKKKLDLLGFQRTLNEQFLEIFENKKNGTFNQQLETEDLGLEDHTMRYKFFFPLKELKTIANDNKMEQIALHHSFFIGFNQIRGLVFTILDFKKMICFLIGKEEPDDLYKEKKGDLIYLKEENEAQIGLLIDSLNLQYTAEYTPLFKKFWEEDKVGWRMEEGIEFDRFVKKEKMSEDEYSILSFLFSLSQNKKTISVEKVEKKQEDEKKNRLIDTLIGDVYLDGLGERPVFVIDNKALTKFLSTVTPF